MTADLTRWVAEGESEVTEFKASTGQRREGVKAICAMLNHRGGRVLFGIQPGGQITGQQIGFNTIEEVVAELGEIDPPAFPAVDRIIWENGREVLVVTVNSGANQPYSYRGRAYRRIGNTSSEMSREEYNRLLIERLHGEQRWENTAADGWQLTDLDSSEVVRTLEEAIRRGRVADPGSRDITEILRGLGLMRDSIITRAAALLFGRADRLEMDFPQCLLRVARFRGTDRTEFIDNRQFHGNAFDLLIKAEKFLRESLPVAGRILPGLFEREDDPLYPPLALREALANAFCHRDYAIGGGSVAVAIYDDRLEVTSSGTLHFGLTPEALFGPHESLPWNPLIARVFYRRGIIESWGRGTLKMVELSRAAGLPRPDIEELAGCVTVRFRPSRYIPPQRVAHDLTDRQQEILVLLDASRVGLALREIRQALGEEIPDWQIKQDLALLKQLELIQLHGYARGALWKRKNQ